jgi:hypothetical protein
LACGENWKITITSSTGAPPLGNIAIEAPVQFSGPIDAITWAEIGRIIKQETKTNAA